MECSATQYLLGLKTIRMNKIKGLYVKDEWWYFQPPQKNGVRPKALALRTKQHMEAIKKVLDIKQQGLVADALEGERMNKAIDEYVIEKRNVARLAPKSIHHAETTLKMVSKEWGNPKVAGVTQAKVKKWRESLFDRPGRGGKKMSEASVNTYMRTLSSFFTFCVEQGAMNFHPIKGMKLPKVKKTRRQEFCNYEERDTLLAAAVEAGELDFALFLHVGFFAGLRPGEILAMERNWVYISPDGKHGSITVQRTNHWRPKDKELRTIPMHTRLLCFMKRFPMRGKFVFAHEFDEWKEAPAMRYHYIKRFEKFVTGVVDRFRVTPYTLRHSFATHMAMGGAEPVTIAAALGDDLQVVLDNYIGFMPSQAAKVNLIR